MSDTHQQSDTTPAPETKCKARLTVTIKRTTYEFRCHEDLAHSGEHRTPQGSTWVAR